MSYSLSLFAGAGWQFFDNNGTILSGGKLYTYAAGTTTPLTTYTSSSGAVANTNPIILDSAGRVPYEIWINTTSTAKFILRDSTDVLIGTWDNIPSYASSLNLTGTNNAVAYFNSVGTFTSSSNMTFDGSNLTVAGGITAGSNVAITGNISTTGTATFTGLISSTAGISSSTPAVTQSAGDNSTKIATTAFVANTSAKAKIQPLTVTGPSGGALTISLDPTTLDFRNTSTSSGTVTTVSNASTLNLTLSGAATLGTSSGVPARLVVLAIYNSSISMELAIVNLAGGQAVDECNIISTSAISSGTSASTYYSTTARSSVAYRVVGIIDVTNTSSSWGTPTLVQGWGGQVLNGIQSFTNAASGSVKLPSGLIIKWGKSAGFVNTSGTISFSSSFTTLYSLVSWNDYGGANGYVYAQSTFTTSGFSYNWNTFSTSGNGAACNIYYIAIGV